MRDPRQILGLNITTAQMYPHLALFGAEGEEEKPGGQEPPTETPPETPPAEEEPAGGQEPPSTETFTREYVEGLRRESAQYRKKAQEAEEREKKAREAEMSELEKAQTQAREAQERAEAAERSLKQSTISSRIRDIASELTFNDPADAESLLTISELNTDDEGLPTKAAIKGALEKLATKKPYLLKEAGSGDGGQGGPNPPTDKTEERTKELVGRGRVMIS